MKKKSQKAKTTTKITKVTSIAKPTTAKKPASKPTSAKKPASKPASAKKPASKPTNAKKPASKPVAKLAVKVNSKSENIKNSSCPTTMCKKHCGCKFLEYIGFLRLSPRLNRQKFLILHIFWGIIGSLLFSSLFNFEFYGDVSTMTNQMLYSNNYSIYQTIVLCIAFPLLFINNIFMTKRRLNDFDLKGWWLLLCLIPFIGLFWYIAIYFIPGTKGKNRFGEDPLTMKCNY